MSLPPSIAWRWQPCDEPAAPRAVVAWGEAARRLHARLAALDEARQGPLQACASGDVLLATGPSESLPWVEGGRYAAPSADAPGLWLPTLWQPDVPHDLLAQALRRRHPRQPLLLWREPAALLPLDRLLPLTPALLACIAAHWAPQEQLS